MTELDGYLLHGFFKSGARRVGLARARIDGINVFPVPDGDTGSNMAATLMNAIDAIEPGDSASETLAALADAALDSARGNSGVILAQFIYGLSEAVVNARVRTRDFAHAAVNAYARARAAIADPKEGTILSVIKDWSSSLLHKSEDIERFDDLLHATAPELEESLRATKDGLPQLRAAGVVDAGAAGFVEFVAGARDFLSSGAPAFEAERLGDAPAAAASHEHADTEAPKYRYCAEAIVSGAALDPAALRAGLEPLGDSLIVAAGRARARVHLHTNDAAAMVRALSRHGTVSAHKVDDMQLQYLDAHGAHPRVAVVTDSCCDLPASMLRELGVHVVPLVLGSGETEYLDRLTISPELFWELSGRKGTFPRTSQPPSSSFDRLYSGLLSHYDSVLSVHLASALSGTCEAARRSAQKAGADRVSVVDSRHLSASLGLVVYRLAKAIQDGMGAADALRLLPQWSKKARQFVSVTNLKYMVRGGRVSPLKGAVAKLLNLKPIVSVDDEGKSLLYGKAFSEEANFRKILGMVSEIHVKQPLLYYALGHARAPEKAERVAKRLEARLGFPPLYITEISPVVALNSGPGAVSVVTMSR